MDKTERLLDLIAFFLEAHAPVSWAELREAFPEEYGEGSNEACERKFERDKAELADLGVALEYRPIAPSEDAHPGYVLARQDYYLPELRFSPEEAAVLFSAGSAALAAGAFPGRSDLAHALRKIAFSAENGRGGSSPLFADLGEAKPAAAEHLERLWPALLARKRVTLRYRGIARGEETTRVVEPWGLCLRRGAWVLVGFCQLRKAKRTFHVERILEVSVNPEKPKSPDFEVPAEFRIGDVAKEQVWEHRFHEPLDVELRLGPTLAPFAARHFPNARLEPEADAVRIRVRATYLDGLLQRVLSLGEGAKVVGPERARARLNEMLDALTRAHGEAA